MLQIWDWQIAGESAYRLMLELVFLSFMLWFLEYRIFDKYLMPFLNFSKNTIGMFLDTVGRKKSRVLYRMKTDFEYVDCEDPIALIKDNDPKNEAERVKKLDSNQAIKVENLRKSYVYNEFAVNDLSYAVQYGECFSFFHTVSCQNDARLLTFHSNIADQSPHKSFSLRVYSCAGFI